MKAFKLTEVQADAILNMRLRSLRKLEEMEIRTEDKDLRVELKGIKALLASEDEQWKRSPTRSRRCATRSGRRRRSASAARSLRTRRSTIWPPSKRRWSSASRSRWSSPRRAGSATLKGHVEDLSSLAFKTDDKLGFAFFAETTSKLLLFATNGRFYTLDASKLPGGRGHGEPIRLFIDMEQDADIVTLFVNKGGRKFLVGQP